MAYLLNVLINKITADNEWNSSQDEGVKTDCPNLPKNGTHILEQVVFRHTPDQRKKENDDVKGIDCNGK